MKTPLAILAIIAVLLLAFQLFGPRPGPDVLQARTDLPWQISVNPDGSSRVFDIDLGRATLGDVMAKFGALEGLALFEPGAGPMSLEAYFGNVRFGPLNAKVVARLQADEAELLRLREHSARREGSPTGDWKFRIDDDPAVHAQRRVTAITYLPATRGLDADFFRARFGEPVARLRENEQAESWFYPELGLAVLIDEEAGEVLEYQPPRDFVMPPGVSPNPARQ